MIGNVNQQEDIKKRLLFSSREIINVLELLIFAQHTPPLTCGCSRPVVDLFYV